MCSLSGASAPGAAGGSPLGQLPDLVAQLVRGDGLDRRDRARLLGRIAVALGSSAREAGVGAVARGRWLADVVMQVAPDLPIRNIGTLAVAHGGLQGDALADAMVVSASRATAAVGAAGGALAAVEFAVPPTLLTAPVQLAAESVVVVAIELRLVAELHEVYGLAVRGTPAQQATAYALAWSRQRGVDPFRAGGIPTALGTAARRELRTRLMKRSGRNLVTFAPFLAGAVAGAELNRRQTRSLGEKMAADLRKRGTGWHHP